MRVKLGDVFQQRKGFITIDDDQEYKRCRIQVRAQGIVLRDQVLGSSIKTKKQQVCKTGDFVVAEIDAKVGGFGFIPEELDGSVVSSHYFIFELDKSKMLQEYFDILISSTSFQEKFRARGSTNYAAIRPHDFLNIEIELPGIERQAEIAKRYSSFQVLVNKVSQKIIRSKFLAQRIKANYFSSALKKIDGAYQYDLGDVVSFQRGKSKHRPRNDSILFENGKIPFVQTGNVSSAKNTDFFIKSFDKQYGDLGIQQSKVWPKRTICLTIAANIAEIGILSFDACFPDSVVAVIPSELKIDKDFLFFYLIHLQEKLRLEAPSTAQKNINLAILNKTKIILPPIETQRDISKSMKAIYKYSDSLLSNFRKLNNNIDELSDTFLGKNL